MKKVFKYPLPAPIDTFVIMMPIGAEILDVQVQNLLPYIWALVDADPNAPIEARMFRWAGTGHQIDDSIIDHIGTWQDCGGALIWHLFEIKKVSSSNGE